ncbi:MAG: hypothetical protein JWR80_3179 [Bradyrhizobium sp.]|nr:hypothetical protein [Bradyrhizobium sp.]
MFLDASEKTKPFCPSLPDGADLKPGRSIISAGWTAGTGVPHEIVRDVPREAAPRFAMVRRLMRRPYGALKLLGAPVETRRLKQALPGTALHHLVAAHRLSSLAARPFVSAGWPTSVRLARAIEHCEIIDQLGHPFNLGSDDYAEIAAFRLGEDECRFMLDQPIWLGCDGLLTASLWVGIDRVFSISFCLSDAPGARTAYVGGVQGRRHAGSLEQNRALTKAAHGMRPSDLAFELFRSTLPHMGVTQLRCVSNASRYQKTRRAHLTIAADDQVMLDYDELWRGRGGVIGDDGFFVVPAHRQERTVEEIPARKRSMYRQRYAMLLSFEETIAAALRSRPTLGHHGG